MSESEAYLVSSTGYNLDQTDITGTGSQDMLNIKTGYDSQSMTVVGIHTLTTTTGSNTAGGQASIRKELSNTE